MLTARDAVARQGGRACAAARTTISRKPFDFEELLARIEALMRRGQRGSVEPVRVLQAGDVTLDRESMTVQRQGQPIELTTKEFQLLELLMSSPGKVMSRTRILSKVWNYASDPLTNVVDVYIRRLRTKLGLDPDRGLIRTLRGYGYKLEPSAQSFLLSQLTGSPCFFFFFIRHFNRNGARRRARRANSRNRGQRPPV